MRSPNIYEILSSLPHNSHYLKRYWKFIQACFVKNKELPEDTYTEKHHICPQAKSMFNQFSSLKKNSWNLIRLTPEQHFIAHHLLAKAYNNRAMLGAFIRLIRATHRNHRSYATLRLRMSEQMKLNNPLFDPEIKAKMIASVLKSLTPERLKQRSEIRLGVDNITPEGKKRLSELWQGVPKGIMTQTHKDNLLESCCKFIYITPYGKFTSSVEAGKALGVSSVAIRRRCANNSHIIKQSRSLKDKTLIGKTWLEVGYSIVPRN